MIVLMLANIRYEFRDNDGIFRISQYKYEYERTLKNNDDREGVYELKKILKMLEKKAKI